MKRQYTGDRTSWENIVDLLHSFTRKYYSRALAAKLGLDYDDLFQEARIAWMQARDSFDPNRGIQFTSYLGAAVCRRLHARIGEGFEYSKHHRSLPSFTDESESEWLDRVGGRFEEDAGSTLEAENALNTLKQGVRSWQARFVIELLANPPPEVIAEFRAYRAKLERVERRTHPAHHLTISFTLQHIPPVIDPTCASRAVAIRREIEGVIQTC